jgi:hypothetical protein
MQLLLDAEVYVPLGSPDVMRITPGNVFARLPRYAASAGVSEGSRFIGMQGWSSLGFTSPQRLHTKTPSLSRIIAW